MLALLGPQFKDAPAGKALAESGLLVVAVDMTVAGEAPYPACVQDANYAVRWLKVNAGKWNGRTTGIGVYNYMFPATPV